MSSLKRCALRASTPAIALLIASWSIAPLAGAQSNSAPLEFDVPEPGETITINLQERGLIAATEFISTTVFTVLDANQNQVALSANKVGQYCVTISNPPPVEGLGTIPAASPTLEITTVPGVPTRPIFSGAQPSEGREAAFTFKDNENIGGITNIDGCRAFNKAPKASLQVPDGVVPDTDFLDGELVELDASGSSDPDPEGMIKNYEFYDQTHDKILATGAASKVKVRLPEGETNILLTVTDNSINQGVATNNSLPVKTLTASTRTDSYAGKGQRGYGRAVYGGYGEYGGTGPTDTAMAVVVVGPKQQLVLNDIANISRSDTDSQPGELIEVKASTNAPPTVPVEFEFVLMPRNGEPVSLGRNTDGVLSRRFDDGDSSVQVIAKVGNPTAGGQQATKNFNVSVTAPALTVQVADINQADTDASAGELIQLNVANATSAKPGTQVAFQFFLNPSGESDGTPLPSNGAMLSFRFGDGMSVLRVVAIAGEQRAFDDVKVSVAAPAKLTFTVNLLNITQGDTDAAAGEQVTIDVTNATNMPANLPVKFQFFLNPGEGDGTLLFTGPVLTRRFDDGLNRLRVVATLGDQRASADFTVTVAPPPALVARAGADQTLQDSDGRLGEVVRLDASASMLPPNATATFQWFLNPSGESNGQLLGSGVTITPRLPDGMSVVRLVATVSGQVSTDELTVSISARQFTSLQNLPNLTPNQRRTAVALDDVCSRLLGQETGALTGTIVDGPAPAAAALTADQSDLTEKCRGIIFNNSVDNQVEAVKDITPEDFAVARTQALLFANTQYTSVLDRLIALRGGARGLSLAGLNIVIDGQNVPLAAIQEMFGKIFGSGASADATEEPGGLLSDRWGMWVRGNFSTGNRDKSLVSPSFDVDQTGVVVGTDYRLSSNAVIGASFGYLDSSIDFNPVGEGALDTKSMALSVYGSLYAAKSFYLDGLVNFAQADYDARRNISYSQGSGLLPLALDAKGSTDGDTLSAGLSGGYDFLFKGITIAPNAGFFYVDTKIGGFAEKGAGGLNLRYDDQKFQSLTANVGFRLNAVWNLPWVVLLPGLRFDYVREFENDTDVFRVRFAADPNGMSTPPIVIQTDNPDSSYYRLSLNLSAQFKFGFAGYIEYQRIDSYDQISFQDLAFGFRMQRSF